MTTVLVGVGRWSWVSCLESDGQSQVRSSHLLSLSSSACPVILVGMASLVSASLSSSLMTML